MVQFADVGPTKNLETGRTIQVQPIQYDDMGTWSAGKKIATVAETEQRAGGYYVVQAEVVAANKKTLELKVSKIVEPVQTGMNVNPPMSKVLKVSGIVRANVASMAQGSMPWPGEVKGRRNLLELDLKALKEDRDARLIEVILAPSASRDQLEVLRIIRSSR
jgi:hypothetical protein